MFGMSFGQQMDESSVHVLGVQCHDLNWLRSVPTYLSFAGRLENNDKIKLVLLRTFLALVAFSYAYLLTYIKLNIFKHPKGRV